MTTRPTRLYGEPGAEVLYDDPETVLEHVLDRQEWDRHEQPADQAVTVPTIEEWSVRPAREHLPAAGHVVEWLRDWTNENGEWSDDWGQDAAFDPKDVEDAAEKLLDTIAGHMTACMADRHLRDVPVARDGEVWLIDGEPAWRTKAEKDPETGEYRSVPLLRADGTEA